MQELEYRIFALFLIQFLMLMFIIEVCYQLRRAINELAEIRKALTNG